MATVGARVLILLRSKNSCSVAVDCADRLRHVIERPEPAAGAAAKQDLVAPAVPINISVSQLVGAEPDVRYGLISDVTRLGEGSPKAVSAS